MKVPAPRQLPSGNWNIRLRFKDQEISITEATETACLNQARMLKAQYKNGVRLEQFKTANNKTLGELMDAYIKDREKVLSASTINGYKTIRRTRFKNYIAKKPINIKNWQLVINDELKDDIKEKTLKNSWGLLSASLTYAGLPAPSVKLPTVVQSTRQWLDADQIKVFIKAVHGHPVEIPALLALHGLRRSEILGLDWSKINLKKKTISIDGSAVVNSENKLVDKKTNKTQKSRRTVPIMIPELLDALKAVPEEKRVGKIYTKTPNLIWEQINRICEKNNLPQVGVHGLRHSFASLAYHLGLSELETMQLGGWSDTGTMRKIYTHLSEADRLSAENKLSDFFNEKQKSKNVDKNVDGFSNI